MSNDAPLRASRDAWRGYADRHTFHLDEDAMRMHGRFSGIEITIAAYFDAATSRVITTITGAPRLALHGYVHVRRANLFERLLGSLPLRTVFLSRKIHSEFIVRRSSESVARAVLDERVSETLAALLPLFHGLTYDKKTIALSWRGAERDDRVLDDALACVGHLAVVGDRTPYR